ncbi:uncharacterized protein LOC122714854 isoform X2 [Apis laboriosa]|uniref:uncharacterized protein LOC122714854 isoform X2 n=1 Tax=Apis laboriosa TaxID=183418 RepID=UPI001CC6347C|nr:uncharacterized protein LOC122714854 isoform X2 [Apis laboriosa]
MANTYKTTSNQKLQEQSMKTAIKSQLVIKIKKEEEEEEIWISEKELYSEDSSDEEKFKTQSQSRSKFDDNQSLSLLKSNIEQQNHSFISTESKAKSENSIYTPENNINENQFALKTVEKCDKISFINLTQSSSIESLQTNHSTSESSLNSITKDFYDFSIVEDQIEKMKISWKTKKEFQYEELYNEELLENEWKQDINILNDTEDENIQKEILEVENLDNLIHIMNDKIKEAIEETLTYQCENRKRLEKILASNPCETGKLAENTRQFFYLCPKYTTLNTGMIIKIMYKRIQ